MKNAARLVVVLTLAAVAVASAQTQERPGKAPKANESEAKTTTHSGTNRANLVVAVGDSEQRFALWLFSQVKDKKKTTNQKALSDAPNVLPDVGSLLKQLGLSLDSLYTELGWTDWQAHIIWSWGDMGPTEPEVQREVKRLDLETHKNMYEMCVWPGGLIGRVGRACIVQIYACDAARNKFDEWAWKMTIATQMHNGGAVNSLSGAGAWNVAEFIRNNRGCH